MKKTAAGPLITRRELNRAILSRQMLLERANVDIPVALERMAGLQAQYAPAMYVGLWSRLEGLVRNDVTHALEQRAAVQGTLIRNTIHLVSRADYWPFALATREARRDQVLKANRGRFTAEGMVVMAAEVRQRLRAQPVLTRQELDAITGGSAGTYCVGNWIDLVRVPPSGTWERRRADRYGLAEDWVGPPPPDHDDDVDLDPDPDATRIHVLRRYLEGFGPASVAEMASWSGLKPPAVRAALASIDVETFAAEDGTQLVDVRHGLRPGAGKPAPVRFLPVWDALLLVHARRAVVLREDDRPRIFNTKTPHSVNTFLVDGQVEGTWRHEKGHITVEPFGTLSRRVRTLVEEERARLEAFHT